jgi:hypothetical protein
MVPVCSGEPLYQILPRTKVNGPGPGSHPVAMSIASPATADSLRTTICIIFSEFLNFTDTARK